MANKKNNQENSITEEREMTEERKIVEKNGIKLYFYVN